MANGDLCINCDLQETAHKYPEYAPEGMKPCGSFQSPVQHHEDCPVLDCNGECEKTLAEGALEAQRARQRLANSWFFDRRTGNIIFVDLSD